MYRRFLEEARDLLREVLGRRGLKIDSTFEEPAGDFGDLATPMAFGLARTLRKAPKAIAEELASEMRPRGYVKEVKAEKGYINFYLDYGAFAIPLLREIKARAGDYGRGEAEGKIILEHTSANPDGPLHIGHGRNAIIGDTLSRVMRFAGYEVDTQYYVNDMGRQLAIVVWGLRRLGLDKGRKEDHAIAEVYIKANKLLEENKDLEAEVAKLMREYEAGDPATVKEFEAAARYCLKGMVATLERLDIRHDSQVWESTFVRNSSVEKVLERLRATGYAREGEVLYLDLRDFGIEKELVLTRKDGTYLYTTRDIAYHIWKASLGKVVDIWGADHKLVAEQLRATLRILEEAVPEFIIYEFITLPEGSMSTRRGVFVSLDELVEESVARALGEVRKRRPEADDAFQRHVAEKVGSGAVRYNIIRVAPEKGLTFRWEEALDFERQGAPFIQYAYARACRILEKAQGLGEAEEAKETPFLSKDEERLLKALGKFPLVVEEAAEARKPYLVAAYAQELAMAFHKFYMYEPVLKARERAFRLDLVLATRITLCNALRLLGVEPLEAM